MSKQQAGFVQSAQTSKTTSAKAGNGLPLPDKDWPPEKQEPPAPGDLAKIQALKMDHAPDTHGGITLSDTWYEFSDFLRIFRVSANTVKSWYRKGWLPITQIERMRYINKADVENMMLRFRRSGDADDVP